MTEDEMKRGAAITSAAGGPAGGRLTTVQAGPLREPGPPAA